MTTLEPDSAALPRVHLIATGGTIAGVAKPDADPASRAYVSGQRSGESLLQALPDLLARARWTFEQPYAIGSQDLQPLHMVTLRDCILQALHDPQVDAIVVTHGTDTLEDMLFFQHLTLPVVSLRKPVVFTASMLPSDHPQADGPRNLFAAVDWALGLLKIADHEDGLGVFRLGAVLNGLFTPAAMVRKRSTAGLNVFDCPYSTSIDVLASAYSGSSLFETAVRTQAVISNLLGMPAQGDYSRFDHDRFLSHEVAVVYCTPGTAARNQLQDLLNRFERANGESVLACVIVAAPGHGNVPDNCVPVLKALLQQGVNVVRASRIAEGGVEQGGEFDALDSFRAENHLHSIQGAARAMGVFVEAGDLSLPQLAMLHRLSIKKAPDLV